MSDETTANPPVFSYEVSDSLESKKNKIAAALSKAQGEFPVIPKDSEVEVKSKEGKLLYKYKYADLTTIISHTRPAMSKNGLSFTQGIVDGGFATLVLHDSGQSLETGFIPCEVPRNADMKQVAGMITYVKRISLTAALGVSADEDVDAAGNESMLGNATQKTSPATAPKPSPKIQPKGKPNQHAPASQSLIDQVNGLCMDRGVTETELHELIGKGYGCTLDKVPTWVAIEIGKLLENEDCTSKTIADATQRVASRREAARIKAEAGK